MTFDLDEQLDLEELYRQVSLGELGAVEVAIDYLLERGLMPAIVRHWVRLRLLERAAVSFAGTLRPQQVAAVTEGGGLLELRSSQRFALMSLLNAAAEASETVEPVDQRIGRLLHGPRTPVDMVTEAVLDAEIEALDVPSDLELERRERASAASRRGWETRRENEIRREAHERRSRQRARDRLRGS